MASLLEKVQTLIKANLHSLVDSALQANSMAVIDQYIRDVAYEGYFATAYRVKNGTPAELRGFIKGKLPLAGVLMVGSMPVAWFEFVKRTVDRCAARGLAVWLYDEDPFPSGNVGGWLTLDHPEYRALEIRRYEPAAAAERADLYCFPSGTLLWCGLVNETTGDTADLTARVGLVRRKWIKLDPWDSRYYYPATPRVSCPPFSSTRSCP